MDEKLKACPFCGGEAKIYTGWSTNNIDLFHVFCMGCCVESDTYSSKQDAITAWNRRTNETT